MIFTLQREEPHRQYSAEGRSSDGLSGRFIAQLISPLSTADDVSTMAPAPTMAPLAAPTPPKPRLRMGLQIAADFYQLGLDDEENKAYFSREFERSMTAKLGGNNVIVTSVVAGEASAGRYS